MFFHWLNIYRNSANLQRYCTEVIVATSSTPTNNKCKSLKRSSADQWSTRLYFACLLLSAVHSAYLFLVTPPLSDLQRLVHFDMTLLFGTTPTVNFLFLVMAALTLVCLYQLYWFDLPFLSPRTGTRTKLLQLVFQVHQVLFSTSERKKMKKKTKSTTFSAFVLQIFQANPLGRVTFNQTELRLIQVLKIFCDLYVSIVISTSFIKYSQASS